GGAGPRRSVIGIRKRNNQMACKPGSVHAANRTGWPFIWDARRRTPPATNPNGGAETRLPTMPKHPADHSY
ncbi:hypothetical protein AUP42_06680, partial [Thalassospira lucentensis]